MKVTRHYRFFLALTAFVASAALLVVYFFYATHKHTNAVSEAQLLLYVFYLSLIMLFLSVAFIFFTVFITKKYLLSEFKESSKLRHRFQSMAESIGEGVLALDTDGIIIFSNKASSEILGYSKDEMQGVNAHELIHYETRDGKFVPKEECYVLKSLAENGSCASEDDVYIRKDKTKIDVKTVATPLIVNGKNEGAILVFSDITEKKRTMKKLMLTDTIVKNIREGVLVTDKNSNIIFANSYFETITGYSASSVLGKKPSILKSGLHDDKFYRDMWLRLTLNGCWQGEIWNRRKDGKAYAEWLNISVVEDKDEIGTKYYVAIFSDITERKILEEELSKEREVLRQQATMDALTKLYNRQKFQELLEIEFDRKNRFSTVFSIIILDIDNFKTINDAYGHLVGDMVLKELGELLVNSIRKIDMACRWGGEEFLIITPQTDLKGAAALAENLRDMIANNIFTGVGRITCSFGVATIGEDDDGDSLLKRADDALYISKREGKNKVTLL